MSNSQVSGNTSWTLFHDLRKTFTPLPQKEHHEVDHDSDEEEEGDGDESDDKDR